MKLFKKVHMDTHQPWCFILKGRCDVQIFWPNELLNQSHLLRKVTIKFYIIWMWCKHTGKQFRHYILLQSLYRQQARETEWNLSGFIDCPFNNELDYHDGEFLARTTRFKFQGVILFPPLPSLAANGLNLKLHVFAAEIKKEKRE